MKTVEEIYEEMLSTFRRETGAEASAVSDLNVKLYAVATQVYGLCAQADWLSRQCFPQTAVGEWLDRHAALRGIARRVAGKAQGSIRFSVAAAGGADLTIPAGTMCATAGLTRFETTEAATLTAGNTYVDVPAQAVEAGSEGNVPAGSILVMAVPPVGVSGCSNPAAFSGGVDDEEDEALRKRVLETYRRIPNGANAAFYEQGALSFDQVAACTVQPKERGVGTVDVVVATPAGVPTAALVEEIQDHFDDRREIAVDVLVKAPTTESVDVSTTITVAGDRDQETVVEEVKTAIQNFFTGERLSQPVLRAQLMSLIFSQPGVVNCVLSAPDADVDAESGKLPVLGELTVEVTE